MQQSLALTIGLPTALCIIMFGLGLSLRLNDFTRTASQPRAVVVGLLCRIFVLPALCFGLVYVSDLPPTMAVGMMLLAASPSGTSATILTHLARGDVALSITMVGVSSLLAMITLPITANIALVAFYGDGENIAVSANQMLQIFGIAVVPSLLGLFVHNRYPAIASRLERPVKLLAIVFLALVVIAALAGQWPLVLRWGPVIGLTALAFNIASLMVGFWMPRILGVDRRQSIGLCMSMSIHNAALVITLAMSAYMLDNPEMAIAPAIYGVIAYLTGGAAVWVLNATEKTAVPRQTGTSAPIPAR